MKAKAILNESAVPGISWFRWTVRMVIVLTACIDTWFWRFHINSDGVAYLDQGDLWWKADWHNALNAFWSPLYAWLTGLVLASTRPSMRWEYPVVQLMNIAIFIGTLFCFEFFWRELLNSNGEDAPKGRFSLYAWTLGYTLFLYVHVGMHGVPYVTPDLLVVATMYTASGLMLRFSRGQMKSASAALFGCVLGIGYLAKTVMLPVAAVVFTTMLAVAWRRRAGKRLVGVALFGFLAVSLPFVVALSWNYDRLTFGDTAKLNAAWFISGARPLYRHWQGGGTIPATPQHPTRKLWNWPEVYEFATPVAGTYPVWYDPTYWWAGVDAKLTPKLEFATVRRNLWRIQRYRRAYFVPIAAALMMFLVRHRMKDFWRRSISFWPVLVPAAAVFLMYATVTWEIRYIAGALVVGCGALIASTIIPEWERRTKFLLAGGALIAALMAVLALQGLVWSYRMSQSSKRNVELAERLRRMGVEPGTRIALIGDGLQEEGWARLDKAKIVAEVPHNLGRGDSAEAFWKSSPQDEQVVMGLLKTSGAKAVISDYKPSSLPPGWVAVGNTGHAVYFFP